MYNQYLPYDLEKVACSLGIGSFLGGDSYEVLYCYPGTSKQVPSS